MTTTVASYLHGYFQSLLNLNTTQNNFFRLNGDEIIKNIFKYFFIVHGIDCIFGLNMPHYYFSILSKQRPVYYNVHLPFQLLLLVRGCINSNQYFKAFFLVNN